jgi:GNAT superfamily N-acetyltransferase
MSDVIRSWVAGWAISRGTPEPVEEPWGLRIDVGLPDHMVRHILIDADDTAIRELAASVTVPATMMIGFTPHEGIAPLLPSGWVPDPFGLLTLMDTKLRSTGAVAPKGYSVTIEQAGAVTYARITAEDGSLAARGQSVVVGETCVYDRIRTLDGHQRRGLGSVVMESLTATAMEQGAETGVLRASTDGYELYTALGWQVYSPTPAFVYKPAA